MALTILSQHTIVLVVAFSHFCDCVKTDNKEKSSSTLGIDKGNCTDITPKLCKNFSPLLDICAETCNYKPDPCNCEDRTDCSDVTDIVCSVHSFIRAECQKTCGECQDRVDNLWVVGGYCQNGKPEDPASVQTVPLQKNKDTCNPCPFDSFSMDIGPSLTGQASVVFKNRVLTCGGFHQKEVLSKCFTVDRKGVWKFPSMVRARSLFALVVSNDNLYAVGGDEYDHFERKIERWDESNGRWVEEELYLPFSQDGSFCIVPTKDKIVLTGGVIHDELGGMIDSVADTWVLDTLNNEWAQGPTMNEKRNGHSCFYDNQTNSVYVVGGDSTQTEIWNMESKKWEYGPVFPRPQQHAAAVASKSAEYIGYVAGGDSVDSVDSRLTKKIWGLKRNSHKWIEMPQTLNRRCAIHSMVTIASDEMQGC